MKNFTYYQPTSVAMALPLLDDKWGKTELLAGGAGRHQHEGAVGVLECEAQNPVGNRRSEGGEVGDA